MATKGKEIPIVTAEAEARTAGATAKAGAWRLRVVGYSVKPAGEFLAHVRNWRTHPKAQRQALRGILKEVGWVGAVIENIRTGNLIDGHARIEEALEHGDATPVPSLQVDLSKREELKILASFDTVGAMAGADAEQLRALLNEVSTSDTAVRAMLDDLAKANGLIAPDASTGAPIGHDASDEAGHEAGEGLTKLDRLDSYKKR